MVDVLSKDLFWFKIRVPACFSFGVFSDECLKTLVSCSVLGVSLLIPLEVLGEGSSGLRSVVVEFLSPGEVGTGSCLWDAV